MKWREPFVAYALATPVTYRAALALTVVLAIGIGVWAGPTMGLIALALPVFFYLVTPEYRVNGVVRLSIDGIEVPGAGGARIAIPAAALSIDARRVVVRVRWTVVPLGDVQRGHVVEIAGNGTRFRFSTLTLVEADRVSSLLADLERVRTGCAPTGEPPEPPAPRHPSPRRDKYDDEIDRELAGLD